MKLMSRAIAIAIAGGILLVLPACQIPNLRVAAPGPDAANFKLNGPADGFDAQEAKLTENSAQLTVEEFYNDPILVQLIYHGLAGSRELRILEEEVQVARSAVLMRQGGFLPAVGLRSGIGLDKPSVFTPLGAAEKQLEYLPGKNFPEPLGNVAGSINFFVPLDIWRELRNARDAAIQRYLAAGERRNYFVTQLISDIAENYYGLMALDQRLATLDKIIELQQQSLEAAEAKFKAGRGTDLPIQRFLAEVRKNQSEKLLVTQEIVEVENRINFIAGRYPQPVERTTTGFYDLNIHALNVGVPAQLMLNRPDIRQAEHELEAAGLDVKVSRAHFFPRVDLFAGIGYQAFNFKYLFYPDALIANVAGELTAPLINKKAIQAEFLAANAQQLESLYNYQRVILNAFIEVINRISMVENYRRSIELRKQQLQALTASVDSATKLYIAARVEYIEVLFAQRDLMDAQTVLIQTKRQQLSGIVTAFQALGGGNSLSIPAQLPVRGHHDYPKDHPYSHK
jgi:NodT family efflux transporter outer membrane factor (OMF) lipoprotein